MCPKFANTKFLPRPLHHIPRAGTRKFRILYRDSSADDWRIWRAYPHAGLRDGDFPKVVKDNSQYQFARQTGTKPILKEG